MDHLRDILSRDLKRVCIAGHVNPDGDCAASCSAVYNFIRRFYPDIQVDLFLEPLQKELLFLPGITDAKGEITEDISYDLFLTLDVSSLDRIGVVSSLFDKAKVTCSIDHHISNPGFADINHVEPEASSCSEVLAGLMDPEDINRDIAEALYTGIIHDCGVFQYQNTSPRTMRTAAFLMERGINFNRIINDTFNTRTFKANRILGHLLDKAELYLDGRCIAVYVTLEELEAYGVTSMDLDAVAPNLRVTEGVEVAVFAKESEPEVYKVSLRSNESVDVSSVCAAFDGGGHVRAAGCAIEGSGEEVIAKILDVIKEKI